MNRTTVGPNPAEAEEQTGLVTVLRWSWRLFSSDRRWRRRMLDCSFKTSLQHKTGWTSDWRERRPRSRGAWGCVFHWFSGFSARLVFVHSGCKTPAGNFITDTNKQSKFLTEQKLSVEVDAEETSVPLLIQFIALFIFLNIWFYDRREFEDGDRNMKSTKQNHTYSVFTLLLEQNFKDKKLSSSHRPERRPDLQARHVFTTWCTAAQTLRTKLHNPRNDSVTVRSWSIRSDNICEV